MQRDISHLCARYEEERRLKVAHEGRIILRTETAGGNVGSFFFSFIGMDH